jgi:hypothetical protein
VFDRTIATFEDLPLPCGTLPNVPVNVIAAPKPVTLTVTTPSGVVSLPFTLGVTFKKDGLC